MSDSPAYRWALAWAALTCAFALHVWDEASHDFLSWYNPNALALRERLPWLPIPVFDFGTWLAGLTVAVLLLGALTPLVARGRRWLIPLAYLYSCVHLANGLGHLAVSVSGRWLAPGVYSAPLLIICALWLLQATNRVRRESPIADRESLITNR